MKAEVIAQVYIKCPACKKGQTRIDHLSKEQLKAGVGPWSCETCGVCYKIYMKKGSTVLVRRTKEVNKPVTIILRSRTVPPITIKVNSWLYDFLEKESREEILQQQKYYYEEHTCPINYLRVEEVEFKGDDDPHGVFEFVGMEEGHYKDTKELTLTVEPSKLLDVPVTGQEGQ